MLDEPTLEDLVGRSGLPIGCAKGVIPIALTGVFVEVIAVQLFHGRHLQAVEDGICVGYSFTVGRTGLCSCICRSSFGL